MDEKDKFHEMLIGWIDVNRATAAVRRAAHVTATNEIVPWTCRDRKVKLAWKN